MKKIKGKNDSVFLLLVGALLVIATICGLVAVINNDKSNMRTVRPDYFIGGLDSNSGKYVATKGSIYTKHSFECQGLKTTLNFDATITYGLYFFDENEKFMISQTSLETNVNEIPVNAKYVRIVITPKEDSKVSWYEKSKYSSQLKVEVFKEQKFVHQDVYGDDLFTYLGQGYFSADGFVQDTTSEKSFYFSNDIGLTDYSRIKVYVPKSTTNFTIDFYSATSTKVALEPSLIESDSDFEIRVYDLSGVSRAVLCWKTGSTMPQIRALIG